MKILRRLLLTALLLVGAAPLLFGSVPPVSFAHAKLGEAGSAVARGVGHATSSTAVYGGKFEDALKANLISAASAQGFEFIGHNLYDNPEYKDMNLPPKVVVHGLVGGVMAQISGGDFKSGVIATATAHVIGENLIGPMYADRVIRGEMSATDAKRQIDAIAATVAGAVTVMANGKQMSDKELSVSMAMAHSVVDNNYLKGFDAYVAFGQGIVAGGSEKAWNDLKTTGLALASPRQTVEALGKLLSSPEAMKGVAKDTYNELVRQYKHIAAALYSDKAYEGDAAKLAGKDAGKLTLALVEAYGGVKGLTVVAKGVGKAAGKGLARMKKVDMAKAGDVKPEGNYSGLNDPANTYRAPSDNKLRAGKDHPNRTGTIARNPDVLKVSKDYQVTQTVSAREMNQAMKKKGLDSAWRDVKGNVVQLGTLKSGAKFEMIVDEKQLEFIKNNDFSRLGKWASENKLPNKVQPARDATAVKQAWKDDRNGQKLYKIELEVKQGSSGVKTKRGVVGKMRDEGLNRKLPGGVVQHEFVDRQAAIKSLRLNRITPLESRQ